MWFSSLALFVENIIMFVKVFSRGQTIILYVDDMIIIGDDLNYITVVKQYLQQHFEIKDLSRLHYFLGLEVTYSHMATYYLNRSILLNL